jgi:hypothetical protein
MAADEAIGGWRRERKSLSYRGQQQQCKEEDEIGRRNERISRHSKIASLLSYGSIKENRSI